MAEITLKVRAKINLSLGIRGVDARGYHNLDMLLTSVSDIYDLVKTYDSDEIVVYMDGDKTDENNTAYKALKLIKDNYGVTLGANIKKGVPFSAGLGGSSCDASGVFVGFAELYNVKIDDLVPLADEVGSDVAFMMRGGSAISRGQGSDLTFVELPKLEIVVMKASGGSDTRAVFKKYDELMGLGTVDNKLLIEKIQEGKEYSNLLVNQLYLPASGLNPEIKRLYDEAKKVTDYVVMSGSGSSIVAVLHNDDEKERILSVAESAEYHLFTTTSQFGLESI